MLRVLPIYTDHLLFLQDKEALQQQVTLLKLASQEGVVAIQKQLADVVAERDVALEQVRGAEQQAAAETAHRVRLEGSAQDVQQQLSRQTAEAAKAHQACKKLQEQVIQIKLECSWPFAFTVYPHVEVRKACQVVIIRESYGYPVCL